MRITRKELSERVALSMDTSSRQATECVNAVLQEIANCIERGEEVTLLNFGKFGGVNRKARRGRNPSTGEPMIIPARKTLRFYPSKNLKWESSVEK